MKVGGHCIVPCVQSPIAILGVRRSQLSALRPILYGKDEGARSGTSRTVLAIHTQKCNNKYIIPKRILSKCDSVVDAKHNTASYTTISNALAAAQRDM